MMQSNSEDEKREEGREKNELQHDILKSEKENDFGGAVEFSQELEKKILSILGKSSKYICLIIFYYE